MLGSPGQERRAQTGGSPAKGHQDGEGAGAALQGGGAERAGTVQPGAEKARGIVSRDGNIQREGTKEMEPGSSQWCPGSVRLRVALLQQGLGPDDLQMTSRGPCQPQPPPPPPGTAQKGPEQRQRPEARCRAGSASQGLCLRLGEEVLGPSPGAPLESPVMTPESHSHPMTSLAVGTHTRQRGVLPAAHETLSPVGSTRAVESCQQHTSHRDLPAAEEPPRPTSGTHQVPPAAEDRTPSLSSSTGGVQA